MRKEYRQLSEAYNSIYEKPSALEKAEEVYGVDPDEANELEGVVDSYKKDLEPLYSAIEEALKDKVEEVSKQDDGCLFVNFSGKGYKINIKPA